MTKESYDQLAVFSVVARERSFTRAAAKLGLSQPALSRSMRRLEERLGVRLLARTTRSVLPTKAGEHLLKVVTPRFEEINHEVALLSEFRTKPAGSLRITAGEHAAITVLQPVLAKLLPDHPNINIEIIVDYGLIGYRGAKFRRRCPAGGAGRQGHDCSARWPRPTDGGCWLSRLLRP